MFINRENDGILNFDESQIREIVNLVKSDNAGTTSKVITKVTEASNDVKTEEMKETTVSRLTDENSNLKTISYD